MSYFKELYTQEIDNAIAEPNSWNEQQVPRSCKKEWDFLSRVKAKVGLDGVDESKYSESWKQAVAALHSKSPKFARSVEKQFFKSA